MLANSFIEWIGCGKVVQRRRLPEGHDIYNTRVPDQLKYFYWRRLH